MSESIEIQPVVKPVRARVRPPGSKSITNRALLVGRHEEPGKAAAVVERLSSGGFTREILGAEEFDRLFTRRDEQR